MLKIIGTYNTATVYADAIEAGAEGQIRALCHQPFSAGSCIRVMPDVHAGVGDTIGTTMTIGDKVCPNLVGVDIGCGVTVAAVKGKRLELQKLDRVIRERIPCSRNIHSAPHRRAEEIDLGALRCGRQVQGGIERAEVSVRWAGAITLSRRARMRP